MATIMYPSLQKSQSMRAKRKSAVEMLAESKAFYVKSETVRDSQQVLPLRMGVPCNVHSARAVAGGKMSGMGQTCGTASGWRPIASVPQYMAVSPSRSLPPLRVTSRRSTSACSDVLQNKLRKLLNVDSRENVSSVCTADDRLIDDFTPISPPAEYAIVERNSYRFVTHKSLPDLHSQPQQSVGPAGREASSNKSTSNKSLSNRDSGESSGHYTHRSEPAQTTCGLCTTSSFQHQSHQLRPDARRDSGSSTQHSSGTSMYAPCCEADLTCHYGGGRVIRQGFQPCLGGMPQQHQDGDRYGRLPPYEFTPPLPSATVMPYQDPTLSPGPGTFKRQKCLRYKQRERNGAGGGSVGANGTETRPILRSKSDISDRYWRCVGGSGVGKPDSAPVSHLEQFFEQLGLNSDSYENMLMDDNCDSSSPVFFSDVSTVDSSRPLDNPEYCAVPFRPSEPPSIVERNARIIKWLCNCRKLQVIHS